MGKSLYVGGIPWKTTAEELEEAFSEFGDVVKAVVITDKETGKSRGFGFVEMADDNEAEVAIQKMDGADFNGRRIKVNVATQKKNDGGPKRERSNHDRR